MDRRRLLLTTFAILFVVAAADMYWQRADILADLAAQFTLTVERDEPKVTKQLHAQHEAIDVVRMHIPHMGGNVAFVGEDRDDIVVSADVRVFANSQRHAADYVDQLNIQFIEDGGELRFILSEQEKSKVTQVLIDWHVKVPRHTVVDVERTFGRVHVENVTAAVKVKTSGVAVLHDIGPVELQIAGGKAEIHQVTGDAIVTGSNGEIDVRNVTGDVQLNASTAAAYVSNVAGNLTVQGNMGGIIVDGVDGDVLGTQRFGYAEIVGSRGAVDITVTSGEATVQPASPGALRVVVSGGDVTLAVPESFISAYNFQFRGSTILEEEFVRAIEEGAPADEVYETHIEVEGGSIRAHLVEG